MLVIPKDRVGPFSSPQSLSNPDIAIAIIDLPNLPHSLRSLVHHSNRVVVDTRQHGVGLASSRSEDVGDNGSGEWINIEVSSVQRSCVDFICYGVLPRCNHVVERVLLGEALEEQFYYLPLCRCYESH